MLRRLAGLAVLAALTPLAGCGDDSSTTATDTNTSTGSASPSASSSPAYAAGTATCSYPADPASAAKQVDPPPTTALASGQVAVTIATSAGDIPVTLDADATPCTVSSFLSLTSQGYFDKTPCHRLTTQGIYVLQCGDPTGSGTGGPGYSFADELTGKEKYGPGTLAMANAGADTNGSQFFLVYANSPLPPSYTVFGKMDAAGLAVVKKVGALGTADGGPDGAPQTKVTITAVTVG